ncbi:hypothetical protein Ptr902_03448 [Pyrenophora tritici-repentis]|nr:hypothetical protein Ptr902_03448 [Pyrenophora tritici-repentis]
MPPGAFELIFVGELKAIATTLKIVKEAAVWHLAFQRHFQDGIVRQANGCPNTGIDPVAAVLARHLPGILRGTSCVKFAGCRPHSLGSDVNQLLGKNRNLMTVKTGL